MNGYEKILDMMRKSKNIKDFEKMCNLIDEINKMPEWRGLSKDDRFKLGRYLASMIQTAEELSWEIENV